MNIFPMMYVSFLIHLVFIATLKAHTNLEMSINVAEQTSIRKILTTYSSVSTIKEKQLFSMYSQSSNTVVRMKAWNIVLSKLNENQLLELGIREIRSGEEVMWSLVSFEELDQITDTAVRQMLADNKIESTAFAGLGMITFYVRKQTFCHAQTALLERLSTNQYNVKICGKVPPPEIMILQEKNK